MLEKDQLVMHENAGVCRLLGTETLDRKRGPYYVLCPIYDNGSTLYVPVDYGDTHLRPLMNRQEAMDLIYQLPQVEVLHFHSSHEQKQCASEILSSGDRLRLAQLTKTIYRNELRRRQSSKTTYSADHNLLRHLEDLLFGELAISLDISRDKVSDFIKTQLATLEVG